MKFRSLVQIDESLAAGTTETSRALCRYCERSEDGVGHVFVTDAQDDGKKAGERIRWSVSLSPVLELLSLPVCVSDEVQVSEDDIDAAAYREAVQAVRCLEVTLGQVLNGLLDELSWHGG